MCRVSPRRLKRRAGEKRDVERGCDFLAELNKLPVSVTTTRVGVKGGGGQKVRAVGFVWEVEWRVCVFHGALSQLHGKDVSSP